jgi:uncharacterized protein (TIGR03118 family)
MRRFLQLFMGLCCISIGWNTSAYAQANSYSQQNLVTDPTGAGPIKDPNLINPWGICIIPGDPFWIADNASPGGVTTLYDKTGAPMGSFTVAPPAGISNPATPTGCVGNVAMTGFNVTAGSTTGPSLFIFDTEDGTISGWNGTGSSTILKVDNSATGAVYKGLALLTNKTKTFLLATNFRAAQVEAYDTNFTLATSQFSGGFVDAAPRPAVPAGVTSNGYAPFGIHIVNNQILVTYALQDSSAINNNHDPLKMPGTGYVDVFDPNTGAMIQRIMDSHMNAPWGVVIPPTSFGSFGTGGNLLVGNFGDGTINAYTFPGGAFVDQMKQANGTVIPNPGLWDMVFDPTGKTGKDANTMYFTAGGASEKQGLFGAITATPPTPTATPDFDISASPTTLMITAGQPASFTITLGSLNKFNSAVSLTCAGPPPGSTCSLSPMSVSPASGGTATSMLTISTSSNPYQMASGQGNNPASTVFPMLLPIPAVGFLGLLIAGSGQKRRFHGRKWLQHLTGCLLLVIATGCLLGASGCYKKKTGTGTQRGTTTVMITGTSGSITHSTPVTLSVQ